MGFIQTCLCVEYYVSVILLCEVATIYSTALGYRYHVQIRNKLKKIVEHYAVSVNS